MHALNPRRIISILLGLAAIGLLTGCGADYAPDGGGATSGPVDTDFVARANAICSAATDKFNALGDTQEYDSLADFTDRFGKALAIAEQQYEDIAALTPPADIATDVQAYLREGAASVMMTKDLYDRVRGGQDIAQAEAATLGTPQGQATIAARREAATRAGLVACAS